MIVTQSLKQSLHVLLLTQPVKDVCACVEVQDEALQLLQAQAPVFLLLCLLACVANTLMDADHDEHGHSLFLNATKCAPDQPKAENSRL